MIIFDAEGGKNPNVSGLSMQPNPCFVCMNYVPLNHSREDFTSRLSVIFSPARLYTPYDNLVHLEPEESIKGFSYGTLGHAELNNLKNDECG